MSRIAVDAMGGDHAPAEVVAGAAAAVGIGIDLVLVGDRARLEPLLARHGVAIPIVHASEVVGMADDPARAIREKKDSSIARAAGLVAAGEAAGLVSAGSTGASMAAAAFIIGRLDGVSRPAIASFFPGDKIILDVGANLSCRAVHLAQFAVMGSALAVGHFALTAPRVGLMNIGEEEGKGRDLEKEAFDLIRELGGIDFVGNVEGRDLARDTADVLVTDGFTGNVVLKTAEGASEMVVQAVLKTLAADGVEVDGSHIVHRATAQFDPEGVGGAHLLGTKGVVVIAHGSSSRKAVANAIGLAHEGAVFGLPGHIASGLEQAALTVG
jgi:glycerol-3-phosphate acyltransferase PlsX